MTGVATTGKFGKSSIMPAPRKNDGRKAPRRVTIDEELASAAEALMEKNRIKEFTALVNEALRERLEREGFWPVAQKNDDSAA